MLQNNSVDITLLYRQGWTNDWCWWRERKAECISFLEGQTPSLKISFLPYSSFPQFLQMSMTPCVWDISMSSLGQLSRLCPLPAPRALSSALIGQHKKLKCPRVCIKIAQQQLKMMCYKLLFITDPKQSTYEIPQRKLTPSQNKYAFLCC